MYRLSHTYENELGSLGRNAASASMVPELDHGGGEWKATGTAKERAQSAAPVVDWLWRHNASTDPRVRSASAVIVPRPRREVNGHPSESKEEDEDPSRWPGGPLSLFPTPPVSLRSRRVDPVHADVDKWKRIRANAFSTSESVFLIYASALSTQGPVCEYYFYRKVLELHHLTTFYP